MVAWLQLALLSSKFPLFIVFRKYFRLFVFLASRFSLLASRFSLLASRLSVCQSKYVLTFCKNNLYNTARKDVFTVDCRYETSIKISPVLKRKNKLTKMSLLGITVEIVGGDCRLFCDIDCDDFSQRNDLAACKIFLDGFFLVRLHFVFCHYRQRHSLLLLLR